MARHRRGKLGTRLDRMVHPYSSASAGYPSQICRRRFPACGAVSLSFLSLYRATLTMSATRSMRYKINGGETPPARIGPVFTVLGRCRRAVIPRRGRQAPHPLPLSPIGSEDGRSRSTTITWVDQKVDEDVKDGPPICHKESENPPVCRNELEHPALAPHGESSLAWAENRPLR